VEVAPFRKGRVAVRDSKDPAGPVLIYNEVEWSAFLAGARNREFDDLLQPAVPRSGHEQLVGLSVDEWRLGEGSPTYMMLQILVVVVVVPEHKCRRER
jgi:hypothetical protein